jgi:CDP-diacylglycerol--glycerol-3-phosphate 3-phosphatidyltransferase
MLFKNTPSLTSYFADLIETIASFSYILKPTKRIDEDSFELVLTKYPDPVTQSTLFRKNSSLIMKGFIKKWVKHCIEQAHNLSNTQNVDTLIFPVIQMNPLYIRQDELATLAILDAISMQGNKNHSEDKLWRVFFTSGYFNFTRSYKEKILHATAKFQLLAASPEVFEVIKEFVDIFRIQIQIYLNKIISYL